MIIAVNFFQFKQLERRSLKKIRASTGFEPMTLLPMCGFIAQLVEHRTGIAEVMDSNPVEALIFFRLLLSNCLNWKKFTAMITLHFHLIPQYKYELFHIYFTQSNLFMHFLKIRLSCQRDAKFEPHLITLEFAFVNFHSHLYP